MLGAPSQRTLCSTAGILPFVLTATRLDVTGALDEALDGHQNPNLTHTTDSSMTALSLSLSRLLGGDDISDVALLDTHIAAGLMTHVPSQAKIHRRHRDLAA